MHCDTGFKRAFEKEQHEPLCEIGQMPIFSQHKTNSNNNHGPQQFGGPRQQQQGIGINMSSQAQQSSSADLVQPPKKRQRVTLEDTSPPALMTPPALTNNDSDDSLLSKLYSKFMGTSPTSSSVTRQHEDIPPAPSITTETDDVRMKESIPDAMILESVIHIYVYTVYTGIYNIYTVYMCVFVYFYYI